MNGIYASYTVLTKLTLDTSIFRMDTIMRSDCISRAVHKSALSPSALDIIQEDGTSSLAKASKQYSS